MRRPRHQEFENVIANYFNNAGLHAEDEQVRLTEIFKRADRVVKTVTNLWKATVEKELADRLVINFTADTAISPEATGQPPAYFRIKVPLALIHRLSDITNACEGALRSKPFSSSNPSTVVLIALLLAFGHELHHAIRGHVGLTRPDGAEAPNDFQEASSDFIAAACVARWLINTEVKAALEIGAYETRVIGFQVMYAVTLLTLTFQDESGKGYPTQSERLSLFLDGFAFGCQGVWWEVHPLITITRREPPSAVYDVFAGASLGQKARLLWFEMPQEFDVMSRVYAPADQITRREWYDNAPLLRPIAKQLLKLVPRLLKRR